MTNLSTLSCTSLNAALAEPDLDVRLRIATKVVCEFERQPGEATFRVAKMLRKVLRSVIDSPDAVATQVHEATSLHSRLKTFQPVEKTERKKGGEDLVAACNQRGGAADDAGSTGVVSSDDWDGLLTHEEAFRLIGIERTYTIFAHGHSVLRPGANVQEMLMEALDGRRFDTENLLTLHACLQRQSGVGGFFFAGTVLFQELDRVLRASGALPPLDLQAKTYGQRLLEELQARD